MKEKYTTPFLLKKEYNSDADLPIANDTVNKVSVGDDWSEDLESGDTHVW